MKHRAYRTSDLHASAFLQEQGFQLIGTESGASGRVVFIFADPSETATDEVARYLNGADVAAIRFADRLRHLKRIVMRGWGE